MFLFCDVAVCSTFNCEDFDDGSVDGLTLLRSDYSVDCRSAEHQTHVGVAYFGIVLYPIGVPFFILMALWPYRKELSDVASRKSSRAKSRHLSFFCADYKGTMCSCQNQYVCFYGPDDITLLQAHTGIGRWVGIDSVFSYVLLFGCVLIHA
jgi:hypothetical protein